MPKIKIRDIPKDIEVSKEELKKVRGGSYPTTYSILQSRYPSYSSPLTNTIGSIGTIGDITITEGPTVASTSLFPDTSSSTLDRGGAWPYEDR